MRAKTITILIALVLSINLISSALAITTAAIGNSRMVLRASPGETIEKSIQVINRNDVPITIELSASGDLADKIKFKEESFTLQAGKEKAAEFSFKAQDSGQTETKIQVKFLPEEGAAVALAATVIVIVSGENTEDGNNEETTEQESNGSDEEQTQNTEEENNSGFSFRPGRAAIDTSTNFKFSPLVLLSISTIVLLIALIVLMAFSRTKPKRSMKQK